MDSKHFSKNGLIAVYLVVWKILCMIYPERSTCNLLYLGLGGGVKDIDF